MKKLIDAYIYRESSKNIEFLILQRAKNKIYAGQWRMVGGKVKENEDYADAALREIQEEIQLTPSFFWVVPSVNTFFEAKTNQILHIPAFAAKAPELRAAPNPEFARCVTTLNLESSRAKSARMLAVASVEPSFTKIHSKCL